MNLDLWYNLVYIVFGNIYSFMIVTALIFMWFGLMYDIPKWVGLLFFSVFGAWFAINEGIWWLLGIILVGASFFVAIQIMRRTNN